MFIVPIHHPGIEIQQIKMVDGTVEFCQEFFNDVHIPAENVVGKVDDGWTIASRLLFHERAAVGGASPYTFGREPGGGSEARNEMLELARAAGRAKDPVARQLVGQSEILATVHECLVDRVRAGLATGYLPGPAGSIARLYGGVSRAEQATIAMKLAGHDALAWEEDDHASRTGVLYVQRQAGSIGGGTTEMARNIISERVLGMPREYAADKDVAFNQVRRNRAR
jgi:alkylation response protein AidB-like acyl-CoA dehydrogenase